MGKPRLILIVRHAQSEGNRDKAIHQSVPDHRVALTPEGHEQAREAGRKLRKLLRDDDTIHFFISPYRRTRETTEGILETLTSNDPEPSSFQRPNIKVYEEPRLREQDFGNFQPHAEETERLWKERASYGHFFYRIPNGESGADVYDRVSSFNGSLWRRFSEDSMASVAILVTHGLCSRVFLMAWYHYSVEFFEDLRNINHCEFLVMKLGESGRYVLQNQLRRWSELRRERAQRQSISKNSPEIPVRRWGSTRTNQELAGRLAPQRQNTADLFRDPKEDSTATAKPKFTKQEVSKATDPNDQDNEEAIGPTDDAPTPRRQSLLTQGLRGLAIAQLAEDNLVTADDYGRDGGGTRSGCASPFDVVSEEEVNKSFERATLEQQSNNTPTPISHPKPIKGTFRPHSLANALKGSVLDDGSVAVMADALGDQSDAEVDEFDFQVGTKEREEREMARILANERAERASRSEASHGPKNV